MRVEWVGWNDQRFYLRHRYAMALQASSLFGVVGQEPHSEVAQGAEHLSGMTEIARILWKTQSAVRVDGVEPFVLQSIGPHLVSKANTPTLVAAQIDQDPARRGT